MMIPTIVISIITVFLIVLSIIFFPSIRIGKFKIHTYWIIALLGASILLISQLSPFDEVWDGLTSNDSINPIKILALFFSMTIISIFLDELGLFRYLASLAVKKAKGKQYILFIILYGLTSILTIFTSNDIVILTFTPFICFFCKNAKIRALPYLVSEFVAANTWSMLLIIGNPTNIYLATSAGIEFTDYLKVMCLPTIFAGIVEFCVLFAVFYRFLKDPIEIQEDDYHISSKFDLWVGVIHLLACLVMLVISGYIDIEMWLIASISALSLITIVLITRLVTHQNWEYVSHSLKRLPYPLIPFFLSMFVIVVGFNYQGISTEISKFLGNDNQVFVYGYSSFFASNIINNIPMSILFSNLSSNTSAVYASIVGSNIGAFLTPIGALAGIMFSSLVEEHKIKYSFVDFMKYGAIISLPTITICLLTLSWTVNF